MRCSDLGSQSIHLGVINVCWVKISRFVSTMSDVNHLVEHLTEDLRRKDTKGDSSRHQGNKPRNQRTEKDGTEVSEESLQPFIQSGNCES